MTPVNSMTEVAYHAHGMTVLRQLRALVPICLQFVASWSTEQRSRCIAIQ